MARVSLRVAFLSVSTVKPLTLKRCTNSAAKIYDSAKELAGRGSPQILVSNNPPFVKGY